MVDQKAPHEAQLETLKQLHLQPLPPPPHAQIMTHFHRVNALVFGEMIVKGLCAGLNSSFGHVWPLGLGLSTSAIGVPAASLHAASGLLRTHMAILEA